jgi:hypothetical protein
MASFNYTLAGLEVILSDHEVNTVANNVNVGAAVVTLVGFGISAPAATVTSIAAAILSLGSATLGKCNAAGKGIIITFIWALLLWPTCISQ